MKRKQLYALALTLTVLCSLVGCGASNTTTVEENKGQTSREKAVEESEQETEEEKPEISESEQVSKVDITPDGLWKFDEAKTPNKGESDKISEDLSKETICIYGDALYPFTDDGWIKKSALELIESPAKDSPMEIGPCNKYSVQGSEVAYISEDYLLYTNEGNSNFIVFKKISNNGQFVLDENGAGNEISFSEPVSTVTLGKVMYNCPSSWKYNDEKVKDTILYWPDGTNDYYFTCQYFNADEKEAISVIDDEGNQKGISREELISVYLNSMSKNFELSDISYLNINGYLCGTVSGAWATDKYSYDLSIYTVAIENDSLFTAIFGYPAGGDDPYVNDEKALLNSLQPVAEDRDNLLQMAYDPEKDVQLELINADTTEKNAVSQKYVGNNQRYTGDFSFNSLIIKAYYNRGTDNEPIRVRIESAHDGEIKNSSVGTLHPGSALRFDPVMLNEASTGYYIVRLVNDDTGEVITGTLVDVIKAPEKPVNTTVPVIGMTAEEVEQTSWGKPDKINTTETVYGIHEQWVYEKYGYVYLDDGIVTAIQTSK